MISFVMQKIRNKKILNACLVTGIILLVGILSATPMFRAGALNRLLQDGLRENLISQNTYPVLLGRADGVSGEKLSFADIRKKQEEYFTVWEEYTGLSVVERTAYIRLQGGLCTHTYGKNKNWMDIACIPGLLEHSDVVCGEAFSDAENAPYPCLLSERAMDYEKAVVGDILTIENFVDRRQEPIRFVVAGIIAEKEEKGYFWNKSLTSAERDLYVSENTMASILENYQYEEVRYEIYDMLNYGEIDCDNAEKLNSLMAWFHEKDPLFSENISGFLAEYEDSKQFLSMLCIVLELPVLLLLFAFLYMVVNQILGMETGEISVLTSRGFRKGQVVKLYAGQALTLAAIGMAGGILVGVLLCRIAAGVNGFLQFADKDVSVYRIRPEMFLYGFLGALAAVLFLTIPVFFYAKDTIIEQKNKKRKNTGKKGFFVLLPILMSAFSLYLAFNYNKQREMLAESVLAGRKLDPVIFLNLSFFLFSLGLLGILLLRGVALLIYRIGKKRFKPHTYVALLQIIRGDGESRFIAVFLILTVAMGIVDANVAGTINANTVERIEYDAGADVAFTEQWQFQTYLDQEKQKAIRYYEEPDFVRFADLTGDQIQQLTRVLKDENVSVHAGQTGVEDVCLLGITPKEYGQTATLSGELNEVHWYHLLNELAKNTDGFLLSSDLAQEMHLSVGDSLYCKRQHPLMGTEDGTYYVRGKVVGIFDALPGAPLRSILGNRTYITGASFEAPYEIWMRLSPGVSGEALVAAIEDAGIRIEEVRIRQSEVERKLNSSMLQITNGLLTLRFLISLILCTIGFLIYWISAIKKRELLFGIYRAMGMRAKEVNRMLLLEQILSSLFAGILGVLSGLLASFVHVGILLVVYLPSRHNIAGHAIVDFGNLGRFGVMILCMILLCLFIMRRQIKGLNVAQAIKMGED